jgi:hypothetical protein
MSAHERLREWFHQAGIPSSHIEVETEQAAAVKCRVQTRTHTYTIAGYLVGHSYLGATGLSRQDAPGPLILLDLPSGPFAQETFRDILSAIARTELVPIEAAVESP